MKISNHEILHFLYDSAIEKKIEELKQKSFKVYKGFRYENVIFDLYAESESFKYIYEFKISKNTKFDGANSRDYFEKLHNAAKALGARLFIIYIQPPQEGVSVSFDSLKDILYADLSSKLSDLFKNYIEPSLLDVFGITLSLVTIEKGLFYLVGSLVADLEFLTVDKETFDKNLTLECITDKYFNISFDIQLNTEFEVLSCKYTIIDN